MTNPQLINSIALAYLGDSVYEVFVRKHLIESGLVKPNRLQHQATRYVSAKAQAGLIKLMKAEHLLTEDEIAAFKRGRNAKSYTKAKHTSTATYRTSTGFEAVFGSLSLLGQDDRIAELATWCINKVEAGEVDEQQ